VKASHCVRLVAAFALLSSDALSGQAPLVVDRAGNAAAVQAAVVAARTTPAIANEFQHCVSIRAQGVADGAPPQFDALKRNVSATYESVSKRQAMIDSLDHWSAITVAERNTVAEGLCVFMLAAWADNHSAPLRDEVGGIELSNVISNTPSARGDPFASAVKGTYAAAAQEVQTRLVQLVLCGKSVSPTIPATWLDCATAHARAVREKLASSGDLTEIAWGRARALLTDETPRELAAVAQWGYGTSRMVDSNYIWFCRSVSISIRVDCSSAGSSVIVKPSAAVKPGESPFRTSNGPPAPVATPAQAINIPAVVEPAPASTLRKEVLDALRSTMDVHFKAPVIFRVKTLRVAEPWAFVEADPLTASGKPFDGPTVFGSKFESMSGLGIGAVLEHVRDKWLVRDEAIGPSDVWWLNWCGVVPRDLILGCPPRPR
jgi:hypothetical protein